MLNISKLRYLSVFIYFVVLTSCRIQNNDDSYATRQFEEHLTAVHGSEITPILENLLLNWSSLEVHNDSYKLSEFVTGPYLEYQLYIREGQSKEPYWLVRESALVEDLRVLDFQIDRFKVVACAEIIANKTTLEGIILTPLPPRDQCGVFVFVSEGKKWKLAGYFDTTIQEDVERDWVYTPDWLKEIIGELPNDPSMTKESE